MNPVMIRYLIIVSFDLEDEMEERFIWDVEILKNAEIVEQIENEFCQVSTFPIWREEIKWNTFFNLELGLWLGGGNDGGEE